MEVLIQGQWGTVCDDFWNRNDAMVVCRQLGLPAEGAQSLSFAHFGQGEGPIVLDNVRCSGLEAYISDCPNNGLFVHNCAHYEDAGVRCQGMKINDHNIIIHDIVYRRYSAQGMCYRECYI